jgi:hypothetical protein
VEVFDHLVARPVFFVHAGVDHQANTAPHFVFQPAVFAVGILVEANLLAQMYGIQRPAFNESGVLTVTAEVRQTG